jgi:hypothetical protein
LAVSRFTSRFLVDTLRRRVEAVGGFAAILHRGDAESGAILVVDAPGGGGETLYEKRPGWADSAVWEPILAHAGTALDHAMDYIARRRAADPDLWVIEIDVANGTQLIAEWGAMT